MGTMVETRTRRRGVSWPLVVGLAAVSLFVVARASPETSTIGRIARELEATVVGLPQKVEQARRDARERWVEARAAFHRARDESERVLVSQLQEAKERGSLPPV